LPVESATVCPLFAGQAYGNTVGVTTPEELEDDDDVVVVVVIFVGISMATVDEV
jgi:hypothetical protein